MPVPGSAQAPRRFERSLKRSSEHKYLVHVPQNYDPGTKYPLFIAMHQKGGPAIDQYDQWNFFTNRDRYIMLCPQFFGGFQRFTSDEDKKLISMMHEMKEEFKYDPDKVFLVGFSTGADFVQKFAFRYPGRITAAGILAARNYVEPPYSGKGREVRYFVGVGAEDTLSVATTKMFAQQMKDKGYDAQFQEFPSAGHALNDDIKNAYMTFLKKIDK
jgi:predicted peptidase